jgi:hypothetical protein
MNLDGETNLKLKRSHPRIFEVLYYPPYVSVENLLKQKEKDGKKELSEEEEKERFEYAFKNIGELVSRWDGKIICQGPSRFLADVYIYIYTYICIFYLFNKIFNQTPYFFSNSLLAE